MKTTLRCRITRWATIALLGFLAGPGRIFAANPETAPKPHDGLVARLIDSGFHESGDTFNGMGCGSDGKIYYVLCSDALDKGAQMYSYDPATKQVRHLGDLTEAAGEKNAKAVPQGKSHVNFVESNGKLYFATHIDYYVIVNGAEVLGTPPPGYQPYPGGHFLSYEMASGKFENIAAAPAGQGILSMTMDRQRGRLYGITWPSGYFLRYDLKTKELKNLGKISRDGEGGKGSDYRVLCRSLALDPEDGSVYFTTFEGSIRRYRSDSDSIETVEGDNMRKDYFGTYDPPSTGTMGYNWRQTVWYPPERAFYGVHGNSGYLFRFDPHASQVDVMTRLTSEPSKRSGMFDKFWYGYLGFTLGPDGHTLYYLTGGAIYVNGKFVSAHDANSVGSKGEENLHLVTYDLQSNISRDHGPIFFEDGTRPAFVNSIAVGKDGTVYALSRVTKDGKTWSDLISIK
ncbi:MAG: hypothetical protein JWQ62_1370 [Lacunisphaera sp.]|nr:hypothetical protein [Lacunisphaera sp.]